MKKEKILRCIKFKTKCNIEFNCYIHQDSNWQGFLMIGREPASDNELSEIIRKFGAEGIAKECLECKLDKTWKTELKTLCKRGEEFKDSFGALETYCVADIVNNPYPNKCPVTGFPFERLAWDMDEEEVIPLYKNDAGKLQSGMKLKIGFDSLEYLFKRVECVGEDDCVEFESGSYIYKDTKKSICDNLRDIIVPLEKDSDAYHKATHLLEVFSSLNFDEGEEDEDEE